MGGLPDPQQVVQQVGGQVAGQVQDMATRAGGGILGFFKNIVMSPINAIIGLAKGVLNLGTVTSGLMYSGILAGVHYLLPDLWGAGAEMIGGKKLRDTQGLVGKSLVEIAGQSLIPGMGLAVAMNGVNGMVNGISQTSAEANQNGGSLGGIISGAAGVAAFAGVAFVAIGAIKHYSDTGSLTPPTTPAKGATGPVKTT